MKSTIYDFNKSKFNNNSFNKLVIPNKKSLIRRKIEQYNQKTYQNPTNMENQMSNIKREQIQRESNKNIPIIEIGNSLQQRVQNPNNNISSTCSIPSELMIDIKRPLYQSDKNLPSRLKHQIYGTTIYIGQTAFKTIYGEMTAYAFQDLIHKGYIIALTHGDLKAQTLYTRLHSSCVTSELMRSLDCDCRQQLNGAIRKICSGNGILFYLIQEGRGCGYVGKSRACMNVQYYEQFRNINTFEAYEMLGMQHDYRQYADVKDILNILEINPEFVLLTNNPDKIEKFTKLGIRLKCVESIQVEPNPFNQTYLVSKEQYGHILFQAKTKVQKYEIPYPRIAPFVPYSLPNAQRFVHVASYYLPLKPVWNRILLAPQQYERIFAQAGVKKSYQIVRDPAREDGFSYYTELSDQEISKNPQEFSRPNWFQINVHYDIVTHYDYLVLKYGDCSSPGRVPIVRIHSQSLMNRFPLTDREYSDRYKRSMDMIIRNGCGLILIFYNDGRGSGFGYYMLNVVKETLQQRKMIGVQEDNRDYFGAIKLIKHYLQGNSEVDVLAGDSSFEKLEKEFVKNGVNVRKYIKLSNDSQKHGVHSIEQRIRSVKHDVQHFTKTLNLKSLQAVCFQLSQSIKSNKKIYSTGIGSSEAHSRALETFFNKKICHISPMALGSLDPEADTLIVISQNLSPNMICCLGQKKWKNLILLTSVDPEKHSLNQKKAQFVQSVKQNGGLFLSYPPQEPDNTLVRITGPLIGYCLTFLLKKINSSPSDLTGQLLTQHITQFFQTFNSFTPSRIQDPFIQQLTKTKKLLICGDFPASLLLTNLRMKMIQGPMLSTHITDYINFSHGAYQFIQNTQDYCVWFITQENNKLHKKTVQLLNNPKNRVHTTYYTDSEWLPISLELEANDCLLQLVQMLKVNQMDWPGKNRQHILYEMYQ